MNALSGEDLLAWVERTTRGWRQLTAAHPEMLAFPCDIRGSKSVAELLQHIVAVELRYAQRLHGQSESPYEDVLKGSGEEIYASHDEAMALVRDALSFPETAWEDVLTFTTISAGELSATRRTILVHMLMHSIRHYAQLATLVRQHGLKPDWPMDYLFMQAERARSQP